MISNERSNRIAPEIQEIGNITESIYVEISNPFDHDPDPTSFLVYRNSAGNFYKVHGFKPSCDAPDEQLLAEGYQIVGAVKGLITGRTAKLFVALEEPKK